MERGHRVLLTMSLTYPHRKKSRGVISGERGGHGIDHAQASAQENTYEEILVQYEPNVMIQRCQIKLFELHVHIPSAVLFCCFRLENYMPLKPRQ
jgi:hypothetical protein